MGRKSMIYYKGKTMSLSDLSRQVGIPPTTLYSRIKRGWTLEEAVAGRPGQEFEVRRKDIKVHYTGTKYPLSTGKRLNLVQWSKEIGVNVSTLRSRSYRHWPDNDIIEGRGEDLRVAKMRDD